MTALSRPTVVRGAALLGALSASVLARPADAAPQRRDSGPLFTQVDTGQGAAATARALAAKGDCLHALASFDAALRSGIDMSIRRDRGLCHEKLGDPYPAMDDFRAYLTVSPDAPDAPDIRARLERLETETGVGGPSTVSPSSSEDVPVEHASIGDATIQTADDGVRTNQSRPSYDAEEDTYGKFDRAMTSPLRRGTGGVLSIYTDNRAVGFGTGGIGGAGYVEGFEVGASIRWSVSQESGFFGQIGYAGYSFDATGGSQSTAGGLALAIGYELRIRLDQYASNQIVLAPAFEYQYIEIGSNGASTGAFSTAGQGLNVLFPHARIGYRHVFGYGIGLDFLFQGGETIFVAQSAVGGSAAQASNSPALGGTLALSVAF